MLGSKMHMWTYLVWISFKTTRSTEGHSGYEFSWSPSVWFPFGIVNEFHNTHHELFEGNLGSWFDFYDIIGETINPKYAEIMKALKNLKKEDKKLK